MGNPEAEKEVDFLLNIKANTPPESKGTKRLPSPKALADEMRVMTAADTVTLIISKANANEKMAAPSNNLKGTRGTSGRVPACRRWQTRNWVKVLNQRAKILLWSSRS